MGTVENQSKVPAEGSLPSQVNSRAQGSEQEKKDHGEHSGVVEDVATENGVGFSGSGNQGLSDDGVVEVVKISVSETKVSVLKESDSQGVADSEMNGVSSLLKMKESSRSDSRKSEEQEKDGDHDGKVVTVDVPIMEAGENVDSEEVEDLSDEGYGFSVGDFVWGKIKSHPWWPGRIYDPLDASDLALKLKQKNRPLLVAYFGDGTFAWCHPSQLKPFEENFDEMVKQSSSKAFVFAVQGAVNEVGRLLVMEMSHSVVENKTGSESSPPLAKNAGIKEGVLVPENGIERLSAVTFDPPELLACVKQFAEVRAIASILELGIVKAQLSAFYLSKGGHKLPDYQDPQPVPGLEDSLMDETVDVGNGKSAVEVPVQGPFEEDYSTFPVSPKSGELCHPRSNQRRKQKSMAEIMGEDRDAHGKSKEEDATDESLEAIRSTSRKRRKENGDAMALKPVQKRKELLLNTDGNVSSAENNGSRGKERSKEVKKAVDNENISSGSKKVADEKGKTRKQNGKGLLSRERKKSKYLSPPFTAPIKVPRKGDIEAESPKVSSEAQGVLKCNGEAFQENDTKEVAVEWELSDSSNHQTQEDEKKKTIDPQKVQASPSEVLSEFHYAAISPQIPRESTSLGKFVDFVSVFRSSLHRQGSLHKVYKKCEAGRKRKKPENDPGVPSKDQNQSDHVSPNHDSGPRKRRKKDGPGTPKVKKGTDENASAAALFVSFWPGSTLPSKSDLIAIYSKFGSLNEEETEMFRTNYTARVCFLRTSDAETAFNHSQNKNPFGSSEVTFRLKYRSAGSKSGGEYGERSKSKSSAAKKKDKASESDTPPVPVSVPQGSGEASRLNYIKEKLQGLTSMLEASDGKSPDVKGKVVSGMKGLLEDVDKMVESSFILDKQHKGE